MVKYHKLWFLFLFFFLSKPLPAQYIDFGVKAGVNFNILSGGEVAETEQGIGYSFGFYAEIPTPFWELYVQPELFITSNSLNFKKGIIAQDITRTPPPLRLAALSLSEETQLNLLSLDMPLWVGRTYQITHEKRASVKESSFIKNRNFYVSIQTGPIFSFILSKSSSMASDTVVRETPRERFIERPIVTKEEIPRFLNSWGFGIELDWHHFRLELRYDIALNGIDNHLRDIDPTFLRGFDRHETYRLDTFRVNLGYYLTSYRMRRKRKIYHY